MEKELALSDSRRVIGRGLRAEKIRTYNFPQNRVTDHRLDKSWHNLEDVIEGKLHKITEALLASTA
jgi:peptide chain release factor 1